MRFKVVRTAVLLVAAAVYIPLVIDWCAPGYGLHQATIALGGYGPDVLRDAGGTIWGFLVRRIGWNLRGLGTLSMIGALISLGLIAYIADRIMHGFMPLATGLLCAAFVFTPGFLRAATRPDPLMVIVIVPLAGLAILTWLLTVPTEPINLTAVERIRGNPKTVAFVAILLAYGIFESLSLGFSAAVEDAFCLLWFAVLGVLPYVLLVQRMNRDEASDGFQSWFFGLWIAAIAISAIVAAKTFSHGRASGYLAERLIANVEGDRRIVADPALADVYLWTLPSDRRDEIIEWRSKSEQQTKPDIERYFPTVDVWRGDWTNFTTMNRREPFWDYYRRLFRTCGNRLGRRLLDAGDFKGSWTVFWEVMNRVDQEDGVAILNLCKLIERGYEADQPSREILSRRLLWLFRGLKMSERLTDENRETAKKVQRTIQASISNKLVRPDQIGRKLLDLDLLLDDWESAECDAQQILMLDRQNFQALAVMGNVCGRRGDYAESERYLRRALETGRADDSVSNDLAFALVCMGHAKEAIPLARSLVKKDDENWNFRETLALALIRSGELEEGGHELKAAANLARRAKVQLRAQVRLAVDRAWLFKLQGDAENLKKTLRVLKNLKGLERGIRAEIDELSCS